MPTNNLENIANNQLEDAILAFHKMYTEASNNLQHALSDAYKAKHRRIQRDGKKFLIRRYTKTDSGKVTYSLAEVSKFPTSPGRPAGSKNRLSAKDLQRQLQEIRTQLESQMARGSRRGRSHDDDEVSVTTSV